jgi:hypothetical protein
MDNIADAFTKALQLALFEKFRSEMGLKLQSSGGLRPSPN